MDIFCRVSGVDWKKVCDVLEAVEQERTEEGFLREATRQLQNLVAFDHAMSCKAHASVVSSGDYPYSPPVYVIMNQSTAFWAAYCLGERPGDLLINHDPSRRLFSHLPRLVSHDWAEAAASTEVAGLLGKFRTRYNLSLSNIADSTGWGFRIGLFRGKGRPFSERDERVMRCLYPHFHHLFQKVENPRETARHTIRLIGSPSGLSEREAEVALLLCDRLTTEEIARQLFISPRTVGKHLEHIYDKLHASGRREARALISDVQDSPRSLHQRAAR